MSSKQQQQQHIDNSLVVVDEELNQFGPQIANKFLKFKKIHDAFQVKYKNDEHLKSSEDIHGLGTENYAINLINRKKFFDCVIGRLMMCIEATSVPNIITEVILLAARGTIHKFNSSIDYAMWTMAEIVMQEETGMFDIVRVRNEVDEELAGIPTYCFDSDNVANEFLETCFHYVTCWIPDEYQNLRLDDDDDDRDYYMDLDDDDDEYENAVYIEIDVKMKMSRVIGFERNRLLLNNYKSFVVQSPMNVETWMSVVKQLRDVIHALTQVPLDDIVKNFSKIAKLDTFDSDDIERAHKSFVITIKSYLDRVLKMRGFDIYKAIESRDVFETIGLRV
uniref:Uncharacterized protein n=1 Tax=Chrysodeixis chalcites nucleopolyhedrovirus TaxID=320432 RepID=T1QZN8_9ABAC|nr:hypothetical protein [Chrysodeixis chalcites nucleopolyhedrovirus]